MRLNATLTEWQILQVVGLPLFFVALGVLVKRLGTRSGGEGPFINDLAVGTAIVSMTLGKIAADFCDIQAKNPQGATQESFDVLLWLLGMFFVLLFFMHHDRYYSGNIDKSTGKEEYRKRFLLGVLLPDLISVIIFILYQSGKVGI